MQAARHGRELRPRRLPLLPDARHGPRAGLELQRGGAVARINSDLANDLGNCLNRVERMLAHPLRRPVPGAGALRASRRRSSSAVARGGGRGGARPDRRDQLHEAIEETLELVRAINRYLEVKAPWKAVKTGGRQAIAHDPRTAAEALRLAACAPLPVMPAKCGEVALPAGDHRRSGALVDSRSITDQLAWGRLRRGAPIRPGGPLFPRIETRSGSGPAPVADREIRGSTGWISTSFRPRTAERARPLPRLLHARARPSSPGPPRREPLHPQDRRAERDRRGGRARHRAGARRSSTSPAS